MPTAAPPISSASTMTGICQYGVESKAPLETTETRTTTGASLNPASASSSVRTREEMRILRITEKTAAASVAARTAPMRMAFWVDTPRRRTRGTATTAMLTPTPRDASVIAGHITGRSCDIRVVRPPCARIRTRAV